MEVTSCEDDQNFAVRVRLEPTGWMHLIKSRKSLTTAEVVSFVTNVTEGTPLTESDSFCMPVPEFDVWRSYYLVDRCKVKEGLLKSRKIDLMVEHVQLTMERAKSKNKIPKTDKKKPAQRLFLLDRHFWLVLGGEGHHPYLVLSLNNASFMQ